MTHRLNASEVAQAIASLANGFCDHEGPYSEHAAETVDALHEAVRLVRENLVETHVPAYRAPQECDCGKCCFIEELPSDSPPALVRSYKPLKYAAEIGVYEPEFGETKWKYWTIAGWRELTGGVWPCERP